MSHALRSAAPFPAGSIVVGVDGSPSSTEAVAWAARSRPATTTARSSWCTPTTWTASYWLGSDGHRPTEH